MLTSSYPGIIVFSLSITFSGCLPGLAVGPDFESPKIETENSLTRAKLLDEFEPNEKNAERPDETADWWISFNDPLLNSLIEVVSESNLGILQAVERVEQARASSMQTFFGLFPTPTLVGQYLKNKTAAVRFPGIAANGIQFEVYSAGLEATWEIDLFGRLRRSVESADSLAIASAYSLDDAKRLVQAQVATAYLQLRGAQRQKKIALDNIQKQREVLKLIETRFEIGDSSPFDTERARALTARTESTVSQFDALIAISTHRIAALMGDFSPDFISMLEKNDIIPEYSGRAALSSPEELLRRRPDVKIAERNLQASSAEIGVAVSDLFPRIEFSGQLAREARVPEDFFKSGAQAYSYGPRFSWQILNLGAVLNNIDRTKAVHRERIFKFQETLIIALEEIENATAELAREIEREYHLERAFKSAKEAERIAEVRYKEGMLNYLDLLTAQQSALEIDAEFTDSKTKKALSYVSLYRALGGSWKKTDPVSF
ncbi:MAG TPA: efflux transporter outer membrane subunit [Oligoflexia bacterium]|nr:efflux transporter outer membrane subunit [Oligoflexia bacterium]HMP49068.1 efflux transporter outer membrane subunit [Oligoflexia bacterium]